MEATKKRITSPAFWRTGVVVGVALIALLGVQSANWVKSGEAAVTIAKAEIKAQFSTEGWALEMWEQCSRNQGEFANARIILNSDCDKAVLRKATEQGGGTEKAVSEALAAQDQAVRSAIKTITPQWPLSIFQAPLWHVALWLFANR